MKNVTCVALVLCAVTCFLAASISAQEHSQPAAAWYNGDWQQGIPGLLNWYASKHEFARVYDDFVVPDGGWTITSVFSNNNFYNFGPVTQASWEIRRNMSAGKGGKPVASGLAAATEKLIAPGTLPDGGRHVRIQVDGLNIMLAPGRYWLSVAPVGRGHAYICATRGVHASGNPPGNNGWALADVQPGMHRFRETLESGAGQVGIGIDFSQGVILAHPNSTSAADFR
jgi:hypothetical protein